MTLYQGLISFHIQDTVSDWLRAVAALPEGTIVKSCNDVGALLEAQRANPKIRPYFRQVRDDLQVYDGAPAEVKRQRAEGYFETFVNDPLWGQIERPIFGLFNEVYAASHTPDETRDRVEQDRAFDYVWTKRYARRFPGATLALSSAAVGNDIPEGAALIAVEGDYFLDYHAYIPTRAGSPIAGEWQWYSGRFAGMDDRYRALGCRVKWLFGEGGPIHQYAHGGLDPEGGWRHMNVCNGDPIKFRNVLEYWATRVREWNKANDRRAHSMNVFTTKRGNGPDDWIWFQVSQPELDALAALSQRYAESTPSNGPIATPESKVEEWEVCAKDGVNIRDSKGRPVGALANATRFWGIPVIINGEERIALRGHVSANPEHVRRRVAVPMPEPEPEPEPAYVLGADVSVWQGTIDYRLMAEAGVKIVGVKVTEGVNTIDPQWRHNYQWARAYGIKVFPYHYFHNDLDPELQAAHFRGQYAAVPWDYAPAGDFEDNKPAVGLADRVKRFIDAAGVQIIYTRESWWGPLIGGVDWAADYALWIAEWDVERPTLPPGWASYWGWQWTVSNKGALYGVQSDKIDLNWFAANGPKAAERPLVWPVASRALSVGGNVFGNPPGHAGADFAGNSGDPVMAVATGHVTASGYQTGGYGRYIMIQHDGGITSLYAHLKAQPVIVRKGDWVAQGQKIGEIGLTGNTTGAHLHFELKINGEAVDPLLHLE